MLIGEIGPPRGINGEVFVRSFSDNPRRFTPGARVLVGNSPPDAAVMTVDAVKSGGGKNAGYKKVVKFYGVDARDQAEVLRGRLVFVPAEELDALETGEFWEHQLVGLPVFDLGGRALGALESVLHRPAQDLWEVAAPSGPVLVPAVKQIVVSADIAAGKIVLDPPEGLFE